MVLGLMLVSSVCKARSWSEWLYNKVLLNIHYYCGTSVLVNECPFQRYFSMEVCGRGQQPETEIFQAWRNGWKICELMDVVSKQLDQVSESVHVLIVMSIKL